MKFLNPTKALIFRIVHVQNLPWIVEHGLHCPNSPKQDPNYVSIGNPSLINKRAHRTVPVPPGGTLSDYVPFYFTPFSMMVYNIKTGHGGITKRQNYEIAIIVSSIHRLKELGLSFVFTNQHAYAVDTDFYTDIGDLTKVDWSLLQRRDFKTDDADPGKQLRYQAEALVHRYVSLDAILGVGCINDTIRQKLEAQLNNQRERVVIKATPQWYF
jgi:hypothetical protein